MGQGLPGWREVGICAIDPSAGRTETGTPQNPMETDFSEWDSPLKLIQRVSWGTNRLFPICLFSGWVLLEANP